MYVSDNAISNQIFHINPKVLTLLNPKIAGGKHNFEKIREGMS